MRNASRVSKERRQQQQRSGDRETCLVMAVLLALILIISLTKPGPPDGSQYGAGVAIAVLVYAGVSKR